MTAIPPGSWVLDAAASEVTVRAEHVAGLGSTTVRFAPLSGTGVVGETTTAEVRIGSRPHSGNAVRDTVVRGGLWLASTKHPQVVAVLTGLTGDTGTGTITVKGETQPATWSLEEITVEGDRLRAVVTTSVDRRAHRVGTPGVVRDAVSARMVLVADRTT